MVNPAKGLPQRMKPERITLTELCPEMAQRLPPRFRTLTAAMLRGKMPQAPPTALARLLPAALRPEKPPQTQGIQKASPAAIPGRIPTGRIRPQTRILTPVMPETRTTRSRTQTPIRLRTKTARTAALTKTMPRTIRRIVLPLTLTRIPTKKPPTPVRRKSPSTSGM